MRHTALKSLPLSALLAAILTLPANGQTGVSDGQWSVYGGDPGHTRYSALDQIDATNAGDLEIGRASCRERV